jgi:hypothetical protein
MIGRAIPGEVSPMVVENTIRGYLGTLGTYIMTLSDIVLHTPTFGFAQRPEQMVTDMPFFKRFLKDRLGTANAESFYDLRGTIREYTTTLNALNKRDPRAAVEYQREHRGRPELLKDTVLSLNREMKKMRDLETEIRMSSWTPEEKAAALRKIKAYRFKLLSVAPTLQRMIRPTW